MSRPLRIEFPGTWYHVKSRGVGAKVDFPETGTLPAMKLRL